MKATKKEPIHQIMQTCNLGDYKYKRDGSRYYDKWAGGSSFIKLFKMARFVMRILGREWRNAFYKEINAGRLRKQTHELRTVVQKKYCTHDLRIKTMWAY